MLSGDALHHVLYSLLATNYLMLNMRSLAKNFTNINVFLPYFSRYFEFWNLTTNKPVETSPRPVQSKALQRFQAAGKGVFGLVIGGSLTKSSVYQWLFALEVDYNMQPLFISGCYPHDECSVLSSLGIHNEKAKSKFYKFFLSEKTQIRLRKSLRRSETCFVETGDLNLAWNLVSVEVKFLAAVYALYKEPQEYVFIDAENFTGLEKEVQTRVLNLFKRSITVFVLREGRPKKPDMPKIKYWVELSSDQTDSEEPDDRSLLVFGS